MHVQGGQQRAAGLASAVHGDLGHFRFCDAALEAAIEVARLDRGTIVGGEHRASFDPAIPGTLQVGVLLLLAELQDGDAQIDGRQRCLGGLGLDLAAMQLVADSLDLLSDIEIGGVEVDQIPGQAEDFALAQAHDEDQDEGGVEGLVCR